MFFSLNDVLFVRDVVACVDELQIYHGGVQAGRHGWLWPEGSGQPADATRRPCSMHDTTNVRR